MNYTAVPERSQRASNLHGLEVGHRRPDPAGCGGAPVKADACWGVVHRLTPTPGVAQAGSLMVGALVYMGERTRGRVGTVGSDRPRPGAAHGIQKAGPCYKEPSGSLGPASPLRAEM